jgi:diguanylate cyclase (GGDEF)-like protein
MRIVKTEKGTRAARIAGVYGRKGAAVADAPISEAAAIGAEASVLGIPEEEFTPRVRDAIILLMQEVDRLRREVAQTRERLEDLARAADQDMLLPILNRRAFVREITRFIAFAERYGTPSSVLYFDLDGFKTVNDIHGHAAGDAVLRHFAGLVAAHIRESDVLARLGGDEFGVILAHVTAEQAARKGATLAEALRNDPPVWEDKTIHLDFSYGVYELRAGENADSAIKEADRAMYAQKRRLRSDTPNP